MQSIMDGSITVPEWVNSPPQIDIESDGQWTDVQAAFKDVHAKCHKKRGMFFLFVFVFCFCKKYCKQIMFT